MIDILSLAMIVNHEQSLADTNISKVEKLSKTIDDLSCDIDLSPLKYIKNLKKLIQLSHSSLLESNYYKSFVLINEYKIILAKSNNIIADVYRLKIELNKFEISLTNIWMMVNSKGRIDSQYQVLNNRVASYYSMRDGSKIERRINVIRVLIKDINSYYYRIESCYFHNGTIYAKEKNVDNVLNLPGTSITPIVSFSTKHNFYSMKGNCLPATKDFWQTTLNWLSVYSKSGKIAENSLFEINFEVINRNSINSLYALLNFITISKSRLHWYYDPDNSSIMDLLFELDEIYPNVICKIKFNSC